MPEKANAPHKAGRSNNDRSTTTYWTMETPAACAPFGPCTISKLTRWPSCKVRKPSVLMAEKWTNTSSLPSSGAMKPKPLASLNHFTVPKLMNNLFHYLGQRVQRQRAWSCHSGVGVHAPEYSSAKSDQGKRGCRYQGPSTPWRRALDAAASARANVA